MATFFDGGWFGVNGVGPAPGGALDRTTHLLAPTIQVTNDGGTTWSTVPSVSDYLEIVHDHRIGGGTTPNPSSVIATFTLLTPQVGIDGIRLIGENGGLAGGDANGFLGVFELEVYAIPTLAQEGRGIIGLNDAIDGDAGTAHAHAGIEGNINDGYPLSRVDTWYAGNTDSVSYVGIRWSFPRSEKIGGLELTMATFFDGGWFGVNGIAPGPGGLLNRATHLLTPEVQVTRDGARAGTLCLLSRTISLWFTATESVGGETQSILRCDKIHAGHSTGRD